MSTAVYVVSRRSLAARLCEMYCQSLQRHPLWTKAITASVMAGASDVACQVMIEKKQLPALERLVLLHRRLQQLWWLQLLPTRMAGDDEQEDNNSNNTTMQPAKAEKSGKPTILATTSTYIHNNKDDMVNWNRTLQVCLVGLCWAGPAQHTWYNLLEHLVVGIHSRVGGVAARIVLDATVYTPFGLTGYFASRSVLESTCSNNSSNTNDVVQGIVTKLQDKWSTALFTSWHFWPAANVLNFTLVPLQFRVLYWSCLSFFWQGYLTTTNETS